MRCFFLFQEFLFTLEGFNDTAWFLSCYQFMVYAILSFSQLGFAGLNQQRFKRLRYFIFLGSFFFFISRASYQSYILLAALTVATMGLSNYAVAYLNYP